jgi:hypothetical protein
LKLFLQVIILLFSANGIAQIDIYGSVKTKENQNIIGANISIISNTEVYSTVSDSLGNYRIAISKGFFTIKVSNIGFIKKEISQNGYENLKLDFILEIDKSALQEVVITQDRKKSIAISSGSNISFNPKNLSNIPSIMGTTDIIKILQLTPGVQNAGDANGYLYVRGGDPGHNLMLYSGIPIYGMAHLLGIFPFYNADHIEGVEFDKSNTNAKYGGRLGATILANTKKKATNLFSIQGNIGLLASQLTASASLNFKTAVFFSARRTYIDEIVAPFIEKSKPDQDIQDIKYGFNDTNFSFTTEIANKHNVSIDAFRSNDTFKINDTKLALNAILKWGNESVSATWDYKISKNKSFKNILYLSEYKNKLQLDQSSANLNITSSIKDIGWTSVLSYDIKKVHFESGLQYSKYFLQPQKIEASNLGFDNLYKEAQKINATSFGLFTSFKASFLNYFNTEMGLRLSYYSSQNGESKFLYFEPRLLVNYTPTKSLTLFSTYTRQNQYINLIATSNIGIPTDFWIGASDGIPAQISNEFSSGLNYRLSKSYSCLLSGFYRSMNNLVEYPYGLTQFNEISTLKNDIIIGDGNAYGGEIMFKKDYGKYTGWLSYTLSWSNRKFDELNNGDSFFAKYDRRHNLALVGTYEINNKWTVGITQILSSGNRFTLPTSWYFINNAPIKEYSNYNNAKIPSYVRTDLSVNYFFIKSKTKESALNFSIYNTFVVNNPLYIFVNLDTDEDEDNIVLKTEYIKLYTILPSISWRFKF